MTFTKGGNGIEPVWLDQGVVGGGGARLFLYSQSQHSYVVRRAPVGFEFLLCAGRILYVLGR